jgi:hypothetical protein
MRTLNRPYQRRNGDIRYIPLEICQCGEDRRGPLGGVCSNCGDAIPSENEQKHLDKYEKVNA